MTTIDQATLMTGGSGMKAVIYTDSATFTKYYCDTQSTETHLTDSSWRIKKVVYSDNTYSDVVSRTSCSGITSALPNGGGSFAYPATNLTVVQALFYDVS